MDKYFVTRALEWFDGVRARFWAWLFDEERDYKRPTVIFSFALGAFITRVAPETWYYAELAMGFVIALTLLLGFSLPFAYLFEWACRRCASK